MSRCLLHPLLFVKLSTMHRLPIPGEHSKHSTHCISASELPRKIQCSQALDGKTFHSHREETDQDWLPQWALIPHGQRPPLSGGSGGTLPFLQGRDATVRVARGQPLYLLVRKCSRPKAHSMLLRGGQRLYPQNFFSQHL